MGNHPNRARAGSPARNTSPDEVRSVREAAGLTQTEAGDLVHTTCRTWQQWEAGDRRMHPAFWELFRLAAPSFSIEAALALHGRIFATLSADELEILAFYRKQGRKFGVDAHINSVADPAELERARSEDQADEIMRRANSTVSVTRRRW